MSPSLHRSAQVPQEDEEVVIVGATAVTGDDDDAHHTVTTAGIRYEGNDNYSSSFSRQPSWWLIRVLSVFTVALTINIGLLAASSYSSGKQQQYVNAMKEMMGSAERNRISAMLNNATLPLWKPLPNATQTLTKIAFGSCSSQEMPQPHWDTITMLQPDLVLLMGDNVYGDCVEETCQHLRQAYKEMAEHASVQGAAPELSVYATLDDHDYGQSDCHASNPYKETARELFAEFFGIPQTEWAAKDGVYRSAIWGSEGERLQVILLDTRYGRSPFGETGIPSAPYKPVSSEEHQQKMLSERQWTWLAQQLEQPADVRLVVSSVQVLNENTGFEAWRHLPAERSRLYTMIQDKRVILLTGDRHFGGFYESSDFVEVTASSFTHSIPLGTFDNCTTATDCDEVDPARVGDAVRENHVGFIEIDWPGATVTLSLRRAETTYGSTYTKTYAEHGKFSDAGEILVSRQISLSDL